MVNIEINGKQLQAPEGATVIEVADQAGITIPRFCYHSKLSIAANCRMCLVEVEKAPKPMPACATPVSDGMVVHTRSPRAIAAQRAVMEFLLINHPLDCPICDQGGECDLQEMALGYGNDISSYHLGKRVVPNKNLGPLINTDMTRCIHCTRCVRFGKEIGGIMELGAVGRGEHTEIGTYVEKSVDSELSGNVIDLCPVGALTSKPYRYSARPWELTSYPSVSPHDCVGANLELHVRRGQVMRAVPRENEEVNETWLADRDRFSYLGLYHDERLTKPMIKKDGQWQETDWDSALSRAAEGLAAIVKEQGADKVGALASASSTNEELFLLQKLMRGLGSDNIDHRLRQLDFSGQEEAPLYPALGQTIAQLGENQAVLLVGANIRKDQPLLAQRLRRAATNGTHISVVNSIDHEMLLGEEQRCITAPGGWVAELAAIAVALGELAGEAAPAEVAKLAAEVGDNHRAIARQLHEGETVSILLGNAAQGHTHAADVARTAALIARLAKGRFGYLAVGGNSAGAALAGALPHRKAAGEKTASSGKDWRSLCSEGVEGLVLLGVEPEFDTADPALALRAAEQAGFVVSLSAYRSAAVEGYADVILPIALFPETAGSLVNAEGRWQSFNGVVTPPGEARPAWKVLRVLGNLFDLNGFEYFSAEEVGGELRGLCGELSAECAMPEALPSGAATGATLVRVAEVPLYRTDAMVRRSDALQQTGDNRSAAVIAVHPDTLSEAGLADAEQATLVQGDAQVTLPLCADTRVAPGCVSLPTGLAETAALGATGEQVTLQPAS